MKKILTELLIFIFVVTLVGCGKKLSPPPGGKASVTKDRYLYAVNMFKNQISVFKINQTTGELASIQEVPTKPEPRCLVVHPELNYLFVSTNETDIDNDYIEVYEISDDDGSLNLVNAIQLQQPYPNEMALTPNGEYLCVTHWDRVTIYRLDLTTSPCTIEKVDTIITETQPKGIVINSAGDFLYIARNGTDTLKDDGEVLVYHLSANGTVTYKCSISVGKQPIDLVLNNAGTHLYVANFSSRNLMVFSVNAVDGSLTLINTYTKEMGDVRSLAVAPKDDFVFAGTSLFGLNAYSANGSALTLVEGSPFEPTNTGRSSLAVDPSGRFLFVGWDYPEGTVETYTIGADGGLTLNGESQAGGSWVAIR